MKFFFQKKTVAKHDQENVTRMNENVSNESMLVYHENVVLLLYKHIVVHPQFCYYVHLIYFSTVNLFHRDLYINSCYSIHNVLQKEFFFLYRTRIV